jgi:hypothetical protein
LSILSLFFFAHCAVLLITVCHFVLFFLWPLCCIADHCLSFYSDQQYSAMTKGKQGQNRKTVISNTAQWAKEKQDKIEKQ